MPIKFRCSHCRQFLGISPSKAGELTDCPACGRTVRVPNLDGTVAPLQASRFDHRDPHLAEALSALSRIGQSPAATGSAATAVVATRAAASTKPPPAVAIPVEPPLPADRVAPVDSPPSPAEPATELLFIPDDPLAEPVLTRARRQRPSELRIASLILAGALLLLMGFFAGRAFERRGTHAAPTPASTQPAPPPAAVDRPQPAPAAAADPVIIKGIAGTVTWQTADGQSRSDGGARVIAFPAARPPQPPLSVAGFRAGAVARDRNSATTTIRDAGGDFAIADDTGRYTLQLSAGRYDLLILSRHQPRDSTLPLETAISELLAAFFDQPSGLVGSVDAALIPVDFDGASLQRDHAFSR